MTGCHTSTTPKYHTQHCHGDINRIILKQSGGCNIYLVVAVGYLVDFWFVVLFIFQAFFSTEKRREQKTPRNHTALYGKANQDSESTVAQRRTEVNWKQP